MRKLSIVFMLVLSLLLSVAALSVPRYTVTVLPLIPNCINNKGHIAGTKNGKGVLYRSGKIVFLDPRNNYLESVFPKSSYPDKYLEPKSINDSDQIVGSGVPGMGSTHEYSFCWIKGKTSPLIGTHGPAGSWGKDINNKGQIVGSGEGVVAEGFGSDALYWERNSVARAVNLGVKYKWSHSTADGINNHGDIVGIWEYKPYQWHAYAIIGGHMKDLGTLGHNYLHSYAVAINDSRQVLGYSTDRKGANLSREHAFIWQKGKMRDLGLMNGYSVHPIGLNNHGQFVGSASNSQKPPKSRQPFLWTNGRYWDLNDLIPKGSGILIMHVWSINDRGEIIADGGKNGKELGLLLKPR
jgi:probable HAF family extracellular repeat protein